MWVTLRDAEARAGASLAGGRGGAAARVQVARELALLSSSDWPFMVTRGNSPGYAHDRVADHAAALHRLCDAIDRDDGSDGAVAAEIAVPRRRPRRGRPPRRGTRPRRHGDASCDVTSWRQVAGRTVEVRRPGSAGAGRRPR